MLLVISYRSVVFKRMFKSDIDPGIVKIQDIEEGTVGNKLEFV